MRLCFLVAVTLGALFGQGCSTGQPLQRFQFAQVIMGVRVDLAEYAETQEKATVAARAAFAAMNDLDKILSDYRSDSEAMVLCAKPPGTPIPVSEDLYDILDRSLDFSRASAGAFDVTVGPLVRLWRLARKDRRLPDESSIEAARRAVGWGRVVLARGSAGHATATLGAEGMRLDFGGIGKGYAADRGAMVLREHGVDRFLIAVAGDIAVGKAPPGSQGWRVEVATGAADEPGAARRVIVVADKGVSTSGSTEQFVEIDGRRYSHIVDPRSGEALTQERAETLATIVAPDATTADALGTAACVLHVKDAAALVRSIPGCSAYLRSRTGGLDVRTQGFPELVPVRD